MLIFGVTFCLTNDGDFALSLTIQIKKQQYNVTLDKELAPLHQQMIADFGIQLNDGLSKECNYILIAFAVEQCSAEFA